MGVKAGVVFVTEFVAPNTSVFKNYINYITRSAAVRNENMNKYIIPSIDQDLRQYDEYIDYMENSKKTTELFTKSKDHLTLEEKMELQHIFQMAQDRGSLMWQTVISFDNRWLSDNNLFDLETRILNERKIKEYCRGSIERMLRAEGMDQNSIWSAAIHYNTDNIHIHVATVQPVPSRELKVTKIVKIQKDWLRKKGIITDDVTKKVELGKPVKVHNAKRKSNLYLNIFNDIEIKLQEETGKRYKFGDYLTFNHDGSIDVSFYDDTSTLPSMIKLEKENIVQRGKFKPSSLEVAKSFMVNHVLSQSKNNEKINNLIKIVFVKNLKETERNQLKEMPELHQLYADIIDKLPADKRLWQYNRNIMNGVRKNIDQFVYSWIQKYHKEDYKELLENLKKEETLYHTAYGGKNNYAQNQVRDLYARLGNIVLKNIKSLLDEQFVPDQTAIENVMVSFQNDTQEIETDFQTVVEENEIPVSNIRFSKNYKIARKYLYGTETIVQDYQKAFEMLLQESKRGNLYAMYDLASCYQKGIGCKKSTDKAQELYQKVLFGFKDQISKIENQEQIKYLNYRIGKMYYFGQGTEKNNEEAFRFFSSNDGKSTSEIYARYYLAKMYESGEYVAKDQQKAFQYFSSIAESFSFAAYKVAIMLEKGEGTVMDRQKAQEFYKIALKSFESSIKETPNDFLQYRVGQMYLTGKGTEKDIEKAVYFLKQSAQSGNDLAKYALAITYLKNKKSEPDLKKEAVFLLHQLADQRNNVLAQFQLGKFYLQEGSNLENIDQGIKYLSKAAEKNNIAASYKLGTFYFQNEQYFDYEKAEFYLKQSVNHDFSAAEYQLGSLYLLSNNNRDIQQGIYWLEQAAKMNNQFAQYKLGKIYYYGNDFIQTDPKKATEYLALAAKNGNQYALDLLEKPQSRKQEKVYNGKSWHFFSLREIGNNFYNLIHSLGIEYKTRENYLNQRAYQQLLKDLEQENLAADEEK